MTQLGFVGIVVENRADRADRVQNVITRYGDSIISRMGVPSGNRFTGIITIALEADQERTLKLVEELKALDGVTANCCMLS